MSRIHRMRARLSGLRARIVIGMAATGGLVVAGLGFRDAPGALNGLSIADAAEARDLRRVNEQAPAVAREFRAAWVTPVLGGSVPDWPSRAGMSAEQQKAELRGLLDRAQQIGLNAVILHVRAAGDAFYPTPHAPWTAFLTGRSGGDPGYDPLAFAVEEAHARGLELHAWFNPFRAMLPNFRNAAAPNHVTRSKPAWVRQYGSQTWVDPGEPAARKAVLDAILDVVKRYDVDGVHIDDYFYPYVEYRNVTRTVNGRRVTQRQAVPFPDDATWQRYGRRAGFSDRAAWRRNNVDQFVRAMYEGVKKEKPWVSVGISPFGIWRPGSPPGITGLDAYASIYADARKWLREGWLDYVAPQLYWTLDGAQNRFVALDRWWRSENTHGRHVWPGLFTARVEMGQQRWPMGEIPSQIAHIRTARRNAADVPGHVHFRLGALRGPLGTRLQSGAYREPAIVPASPWLAGKAPAAPSVIRAGAGVGGLRVVPGDNVPVRWWLVQTRDRSGQWTATMERAGDGDIRIPARADRIAITAVDRAGQTGEAVVFAL